MSDHGPGKGSRISTAAVLRKLCTLVEQRAGSVGRVGGQGKDFRGRGAYSGIWMITLCNAKPSDVLSSGKRHN